MNDELGKTCEHGSLARSCERCDDAREIAALRAEVERLQALHIERTKLTEQVIKERDTLRARVATLERTIMDGTPSAQAAEWYRLHQVHLAESHAARVATEALLTRAEAALRDALSGWRYIRQQHGDLYGVGWDRVETAALSVLSDLAARQSPSPSEEVSDGQG